MRYHFVKIAFTWPLVQIVTPLALVNRKYAVFVIRNLPDYAWSYWILYNLLGYFISEFSTTIPLSSEDDGRSPILWVTWPQTMAGISSSGKTLNRTIWRKWEQGRNLIPILSRTSRLLNFSSATHFKMLQSQLKLVRILAECQTAWIQVRRRDTRRLARIQAVCI